MNTQLLNSAVNQIKTASVQPKRELNDQAASFVNDLFKSLQVAYPAWKQAFTTEQDLKLTKKSWIRAFQESGITQKEQVALGMKKARQDESDFFPSSGKFIAWCKPTPEDYGLPTLAEAYRETANNADHVLSHKWSHPAVYKAGSMTGWFELRNGEAKEADFKKVYDQICSEVMRGKVFMVPSPESNTLEHHSHGKKVKTQQNINKGNAALAALRGGL